MLSAVLRNVAEAEASVLTISQSPPIHDVASLIISLDVSSMPGPLDDLLNKLNQTPGVDNPRLLAME